MKDVEEITDAMFNYSSIRNTITAGQSNGLDFSWTIFQNTEYLLLQFYNIILFWNMYQQQPLDINKFVIVET